MRTNYPEVFLLIIALVVASCSDSNKAKNKIVDHILHHEISLAQIEFDDLFDKSHSDAIAVLDSCFDKGSYLLAKESATGEALYHFAISNIVGKDLSVAKVFDHHVNTDAEFAAFFSSMARVMQNYPKFNYIDSCLIIGTANIDNQEYDKGIQIGRHTINLIRSQDYPVNQWLTVFFSNLNSLDDIFSVLGDWCPDDNQYFDLAYTLMAAEPKDREIYTASLHRHSKGYTTELWLKPDKINSVPELTNSGVMTFNPLASYKIVSIDKDKIRSITPEVFINNVKRNMMFFTSSLTNYLDYSWIPELQKEIDKLKSLSDFEIAGQKDAFITKLLEVREAYKMANLRYVANWYEIKGRGHVSKSNYDMNNQTLMVHIYIEKGNYIDLYVCTAVLRLSLEEAHELFRKANTFETEIGFIVSPGIRRTGLGITGGGVSCWDVPVFYLAKELSISVSTDGLSLRFETEGLKGNIWDGADTRRWDLHGNAMPWRDNVRVIRSRRV